MKKLHFVGIGGAGMAPLAEIALQKGFAVSGSDMALNDKTDRLVVMGAAVHAGHAADCMPCDTDILVYSSAVPEDNPERHKAAELNIPQMRRGEFLAVISRMYRRCAAVSGSHGKTSITSMLVHILLKCGINAGYLIGGSVAGLAPGRAGDGDIFVTEADESDGTHTELMPYLGIVPNADSDHCWSVGGEEALKNNFHRFAVQSRKLFYFSDCVKDGWFAGHPDSTALTLADTDIPELANWHGFQKRNALLALEGAVYLGAEYQQAAAALADFPGVDRRMTLHVESAGLTVIEDYAHHPAELRNAIDFLRRKYPSHHLRVLFQPHRYARLARYLPDFAAELGKADSVMLLPVFAAWTEDGPVNSADLQRATGDKAVLLNGDWQTVAAEAVKYAGEKPLLLAVVGAGDINKVFDYIDRRRM